MFASEAIPVLLGISMLLFGLFYYTLDKFLGLRPLGSGQAGSTVIGGIGLLFIGTTDGYLQHLHGAGLHAAGPVGRAGGQGQGRLPERPAHHRHHRHVLGIVNAIVNISGR